MATMLAKQDMGRATAFACFCTIEEIRQQHTYQDKINQITHRRLCWSIGHDHERGERAAVAPLQASLPAHLGVLFGRAQRRHLQLRGRAPGCVGCVWVVVVVSFSFDFGGVGVMTTHEPVGVGVLDSCSPLHYHKVT